MQLEIWCRGLYSHWCSSWCQLARFRSSQHCPASIRSVSYPEHPRAFWHDHAVRDLKIKAATILGAPLVHKTSVVPSTCSLSSFQGHDMWESMQQSLQMFTLGELSLESASRAYKFYNLPWPSGVETAKPPQKPLESNRAWLIGQTNSALSSTINSSWRLMD